MPVQFAILGLLIGGAAFALTERQRVRRLRLRSRVLRDGLATTARVQRIWAHGKNARRREVHVRFVDVGNHTHEVSVLVLPDELGAAKVREGGEVAIHYLPFEPGVVVLARPPVLDDKIWVSLAAGAAVGGVCLAIGSFLG